MVQAACATSEVKSSKAIFVVAEAERGYLVYSPDNPQARFNVSGTPAAPVCTCPEFVNQRDPRYRCGHIQAVFGGRGTNGGFEGMDPIEAEERRAIQEESGVPQRDTNLQPPRFPSDLTLKRSISPDGRIDSLSIELSSSVHEANFEATMNQATMALSLEDAIVKTFLAQNPRNRAQGNGKPPTNGSHPPQTSGYNSQGGPPSNGQYQQQPQYQAPSNGNAGPLPATIKGVGGQNTRNGWQLFLAVEEGGKQIKHFGDRKKLCDFLAAAGAHFEQYQLQPEMPLNIPCMVITAPSQNGKYTNITQVFPRREEEVPY
jgi:hypothetical protein